MTTIRDIARNAGVSTTTVSHVINNTRYVSDEVRDRVLESMKDLGYQPNDLARSLKLGKTNTLGLILPDHSNPFFAEVSRFIENHAFLLGYSVIICNTENDPDKELVYIKTLSQKKVDGIIFVAAGSDNRSIHYLQSIDLPIIIYDREIPDLMEKSNFSFLVTDNYLGGVMATEYLVSLGHRKIACITGPSNLTPGAQRANAFRDVLKKHDIPLDEAMILKGNFDYPSGYDCAQQLLALPEQPTAIFACNDMMAIAAMRAIRERGFQIPADISIIGFDGISLAAYQWPSLSTIRQPFKEISETILDLFMDITSSTPSRAGRVVLAPTLIQRESCRPL
ncbi:MAG: LacI family DNA-binding transcriptional regulator [Anaerolineaceae bacterium]|nr:LacI family DNA-binding transcriptional regulator [Anaerolineaceae bacterium]